LEIKSIPFRLTIGVTGHRTLPDEPELRKTVQNVLDEIRAMNAFDGRTEFQWRILTPLAEGADRFIAEEVIKRSEGSVLKAVLPLTVSEYEEDFVTNQSKEEFRKLMSRDRFPISLRRVSLKEEYPPEMLHQARHQAYEDVGRFVVDHCDILIALWDREESHRKGGTETIIQYARDRKCPHYIVSTVNPREYEYVSGEGNIRHYYDEISKVNDYLETHGDVSKDVQRESNDLFANNYILEGGQLPADIKAQINETILPYYVMADARAKEYQRYYFNTGLRVFLLALAAVSVVAIGVIFFNRSSWLIYATELILLAIISWSIYSADQVKGAHRNWRAYRLLAERIRCAVFLAVSGVEPLPFLISRRKEEGDGQSVDYQWVLLAFEEIWNRIPTPMTGIGIDLSLRSNFILKAWIDDQIKYHEKNYHEKAKRSRKWEKIGEVVFYCAMGAALFHMLWPVIIGIHYPLIDDWLIFIALILPAVGTMAESIRSHRQFKYLATHSHNMMNELKTLRNSFRLVTSGQFVDLVGETDRLMLRENLDWLALTGSTKLYRAV